MNALVPASVTKAFAVAAAAALTLSGCYFAASVTTSKPYDPSDGIGVVVDGVNVQNLLLIADGKDAAGVFIGSVTNPTAEDEVVSITVRAEGAESVEFDVPAGKTVRMGADEGNEIVAGVSPVLPGLLAPVDVAVGSEVVTLQVPVVDGTLPEYAAILEAAAN